MSGRNVSRPTCSVTRSTSSRASSSGVKCSPAVGAAAEPASSRVDRLVALGVGERLGDVRRQRRLARPARRRAAGASGPRRGARELDRPVAPARPQPARRPRERLPHVALEPLEQQHLAPRALDPDPRRHDARVVDDHELVRRARPAARRTRGGAPRPSRARRRAAATRRAARPGAGRSAPAAARSRARRRPSDGERNLLPDGRAGTRAGEGADRGGRVRADRPGRHRRRARARAGPGRGARGSRGRARVVAARAVGAALRDGLRAEALPVARSLAEVRGPARTR